MKMKRLYMFVSALAVLCGCQHDVIEEVEFNVTLDEGNTYFAGEGVRFNFTGNMENIVFYSGEAGSEYRYHDRYNVPVESIKAAQLSMSITSQYSANIGVLDCWITDQFDGLWGDDGEADRKIIESLTSSEMEGWTKVGYVDPKNGGTVDLTADILSLSDNFCIAFHWHPSKANNQSQRTYRVNGEIELDVEGLGETKMDFGSLNFTPVMMNEQRDAYIQDKADGEIALYDANFDIWFRGCNSTKFDYDLDGWVISRPRPLNKVLNDKGLVVKNVQNYMNSYEYVFEEPGTYKVAFVATNGNYQGSYSVVKEITVHIAHKF